MFRKFALALAACGTLAAGVAFAPAVASAGPYGYYGYGPPYGWHRPAYAPRYGNWHFAAPYYGAYGWRPPYAYGWRRPFYGYRYGWRRW